MASNTGVHLGLADLPTEIITSIFTYAMTDSTAVDINALISKSREYRMNSKTPGPINWIDQLAPDQKQHQTDWMIANSISHRCRSIGKVLFFACKAFFLGSIIRDFRNGNVPGLGTANTLIALSNITRVQADVPRGAIALLYEYAIFPKLKVLRFVQDLYLFDQTDEWNKNDERLLELLKWFNSRTEFVGERRHGMVELTVEKGGEEVRRRLRDLGGMIFGNYC